MKLETLLQKRAELDRKIKEAEAAAARKTELADLAENAGLLSLPLDFLERAFKKIAADFVTRGAEIPPPVAPEATQ